MKMKKRNVIEEKDLAVGINQLGFQSLEEEKLLSLFLIQDNSHNQFLKEDENDHVLYQSQEEEDEEHLTERMEYWGSQEALLQEILERYSLVGLKLREEVMRIIEMAREIGNFCSCSKVRSDSCAHCLRLRVVQMLGESGFNASLCTSKWKHTSKFPGGMHEYIELIASTPGRKKQVPFLIEIQFREEFEMPKACKEYNKLVNLLPEIYIGKPEYITAMIRVLCDAAKRSAKEKKMHMGPWRKRSFMQMKWSGTSEKRSSMGQDTDLRHKLPIFSSLTQDLHMNVPSIRSSSSTAMVVS